MGYIEGQNVAIEYRFADGKIDRFPALIRELLQANVDVIVLGGTPAALAAQQATRTTPGTCSSSASTERGPSKCRFSGT